MDYHKCSGLAMKYAWVEKRQFYVVIVIVMILFKPPVFLIENSPQANSYAILTRPG